MKSADTIKDYISRLQEISDADAFDDETRSTAYEIYHALRWVIEDVDWTPLAFVKTRPSRSGG